MISYLLAFSSAALLAPAMIASAVRAKLLYPERAQFISTVGYMLAVTLVFNEHLNIIGSAMLLAIPLYMLASFFIRINDARLTPKLFASMGIIILSFTIILLSVFYYTGAGENMSGSWFAIIAISCVLLFLSLTCSVLPGTPALLYLHNMLSLSVMMIWGVLALHHDAIASALLFAGISLLTGLKIIADIKFTIEKK